MSPFKKSALREHQQLQTLIVFTAAVSEFSSLPFMVIDNEAA